MKSTILAKYFIIMLIMISSAIAQQPPADVAGNKSNSGSLPIGLGATFIDGETYYLINVAPELAFGDLGIGLDINLRFSTKGKLRAGDYSKFSDYLRIIRYVRWAEKGSPIYARLGQLDYSLLGHGSIIYNYRNSASYDLRKTGIELDLNFEKFGFETVYSDLADRGLLGMRGYVKPLKFIDKLASIPAISHFEIGVTYATDLNKLSDFTSADSSGRTLSIFGFDLGLPLIAYKEFKTMLYFDYAKIINYGSGVATGVSMNFSGLGLVTLKGKYEVRFNGAKYMAAYFNALYERDRFNGASRRSKSDTLQYISSSRGYYGEFVFSVLNTFNVVAGYQAPYNVKNQGLFHAELQLPEISGLVIRGSYDKSKVGKIFKLDENSILSAELGYKPVKYLLISTLYQRTYSNRNADGSLRTDGTYIKQDRVEPKVSLVFEF